MINTQENIKAPTELRGPEGVIEVGLERREEEGGCSISGAWGLPWGKRASLGPQGRSSMKRQVAGNRKGPSAEGSAWGEAQSGKSAQEQWQGWSVDAGRPAALNGGGAWREIEGPVV